MIQYGGQFRQIKMKLPQLLSEIGFNHFESKIYLYLLGQGQKAASTIAQANNIPRSTTRGVLDKFCIEGLAQKHYQKNTQYYRALSPEKLITKLQHDQHQINQHIQKVQAQLGNLNHLHKQHQSTPKVQVFEGINEVIEAFNLSLYESPQEILIFTNYTFFSDQKFKKNDDEFFIPQRVKRGIGVKVLVGHSHQSKYLPEFDPIEIRLRKRLPKDFQIPGNVHIYNDRVLYFSLEESPPTAVITQSKVLADTMRNLFEFMWSQTQTTQTPKNV